MGQGQTAVSEVLFYHLTSNPLEQAAPQILEKCFERGWKAVVRTGSPERAEALNRMLWTYREDSFLPHGGSGDPAPDHQPIYLTAGDETPNSPDVLLLCDGAEARVEEMGQYNRSLLMFDGHDEDAVAAARIAWKQVSDAGLRAIYWAQNDAGGWVRKAESGGDSV